MTSIVLMCILYSGLASCVRAFLCCPGTGTRLKHAIGTQQRRGSSVRTFGLPQGGGNNVDDEIVESMVTAYPILGAYPGVTRALKRLSRDLPSAKATFPFLKNYVNRPTLEAKIQNVYSRSFSGCYGAYTVLIGPQGAGKKFATSHVLDNKPGVLYLCISPTETRSTLLRKILETSGEVVEELDVVLELNIIYTLLHKIPRGQDDRPVTIVLEVERGSPVRVLDMVGSVAKRCALAANVIVILSDIHDVPKFDFDPRQKFFWVDGMNREEATVYAKTLYPAVADHDLELFFDKVFIYDNVLRLGVGIGTLPLQVASFISALKQGVPVAKYIQTVVSSAANDVASFIHEPILQALKASPDGVTNCKLQVWDKNVYLANADYVDDAMRRSKGVVYYPKPGEYRLATRAHRTALLELGAGVGRAPFDLLQWVEVTHT